MASVAEWEDPLAQLDALVQTPEQARDWLRWLGVIRSIALLPASVWVGPWEQHCAHDPDLLDVVGYIHELTLHPQVLAEGICNIDLWSVRTRAEWGLL